ncbi:MULTISPECIES: helix-turn-helix domain-containing protein [Limnochorda]|uniref:helix-turn-helix domain-containing protein n=1 Tax=Limnochorda TaxID=1676651 RepID=UPI0026E9D188|nr:response regulator transcription factor [Limnochorda pilosa]
MERRPEQERMARGIQDLSAREREILELLANGLTNREIAAALYISPHTVKNHVSSIYRKLGVDDRTRVAVTALRLGVVQLRDDLAPGSASWSER